MQAQPLGHPDRALRDPLGHALGAVRRRGGGLTQWEVTMAEPLPAAEYATARHGKGLLGSQEPVQASKGASPELIDKIMALVPTPAGRRACSRLRLRPRPAGPTSRTVD
jgi:hypothetical protein